MAQSLPRSPHEQLGGVVHFPRMLDKIRLHASGDLPEDYFRALGGGFDGRVCDFLGVDYASLRAAVVAGNLDDESALAWCRERVTWPDEEALFTFNEFMRKRGCDDSLAPRLRAMAAEMGLDDDGSLLCAFDVLDADEGRRPFRAPVDPHRLEPLAAGLRRMQAQGQPLLPEPTGEKPELPELEDIRAVVFDIYGTLFISGTGDISLAEKEDRTSQLRGALADAGISGLPEGLPLAERFHAAIHAAQDRRREEGIEYPEVEIREVWYHFLAELASDGFEFERPEGAALEQLAIDYECRVNPVWPMPTLAPTLAALRQRGLLLGIVSNAQFYTRLMFPALLGSSMAALGFSPDCCIYSYHEREGKPSPALYAKLRAALAEHEIKPEQTLYVGNDLRNDIWPAQRLKFRTALFAGDARSLRWRPEDARLHGVRPDAVVTDLWQILRLLPAD